MPRVARAVAINVPHHVTQRGNYQQTVFEDDEDRRLYLLWLTEYARKFGLKVWAYCLMSNHVHFVCVPDNADSLSKTFNSLHARYAQYFNRKKARKGHLWQGRFFSCVLDKTHLLAAIRYVETNPVRSKIAKKAGAYRWSSAKGHLGTSVDYVLSPDGYFEDDIAEWSEFLKERGNAEEIGEIRKNTLTGRPCGNGAFILRIEKILDRSLAALPVGRPRRSK